MGSGRLHARVDILQAYHVVLLPGRRFDLHQRLRKRQRAHQQGIAKGLLDDACYAADMLCCVQEQDQVHAGLVLQVVLCQVALYASQKPGLISDWLILLVISTLHHNEFSASD